jgi:hypothetical protein
MHSHSGQWRGDRQCFARLAACGIRPEPPRRAHRPPKFGSTPRKAAVRSMDTPILGRRVVGRKLAATTGLIAALLVTAPSSRAAVITQMLGTANYNQWRDRRDWHLRVEPERRPCAVRQADRRQDQRPQPLDQFYLFRLRGPDRQPDLFGNARVRPLRRSLAVAEQAPSARARHLYR